QVVPGDTLRIEVEIIKVKGPVGVGKALATVNGEKAVAAEISFAIK
ncbi:MAG: 3-hydroxyacyl-[acyl-carrier-protein] dehydratase FabZ, partial [Oscillospiraceae bacterium]|nr:3-hydroxyacyl-[acyl-carrier-protein] dehydratase FabZ [Oscillospiraceae bacterium]